MTVDTSAIAVSCLKKFLHPVKGDYKPLKGIKLFQQFKSHTASGFTPHIVSLFPKISDTLGAAELIIFYEVLYECVRSSH